MTNTPKKFYTKPSGKLLIAGIVAVVVGVLADALPNMFLPSNAALYDWGLPYGLPVAVALQILAKVITNLGVGLTAAAVTVLYLDHKHN